MMSLVFDTSPKINTAYQLEGNANIRPFYTIKISIMKISNYIHGM